MVPGRWDDATGDLPPLVPFRDNENSVYSCATPVTPPTSQSSQPPIGVTLEDGNTELPSTDAMDSIHRSQVPQGQENINPPTNQAATAVAQDQPRRGRRRSNSFSTENPLKSPITAEDHQLAKLAKELAAKNTAAASQEGSSEAIKGELNYDFKFPGGPVNEHRPPAPTRSDRPPLPVVERFPLRHRRSAQSVNSSSSIETPPPTPATPGTVHRRGQTHREYCMSKYKRSQVERSSIDRSPSSDNTRLHSLPRGNTIDRSPSSSPANRSPVPEFPVNTGSSGGLFHRRQGATQLIMNYPPNFSDSAQAGQGSCRQAPPSPSQNIANGMNGGGPPHGMNPLPTPAGHQTDLNHIMGMIESLGQQLDENREATAKIVEKIGLVRERAQQGSLTNAELLRITSEDINGSSFRNLDKENSELRKALDVAEYEKTENWKLLLQAVTLIQDTTDKLHAFREREDAAVLAWHRSYREQLAFERKENLELNFRIMDMQVHAANANEYLRQAQRCYTDSDEWHELRVANSALKKECRWWKRMAMPYAPEDSDIFSDDDDLIDPEEKKRLENVREQVRDRYGKKGDEEDASGSA